MSNIEELNHLHVYLTYDDVLLLPNYSEITPPEVSLGVDLGMHLSLKVPIISAPMDTVTEKALAISLGMAGGLGIIHRNLSIAEQANQVKEVRGAGVPVGAAVGVGSDLLERVQQVVDCGVSLICVDSAHGFTKNVIEAVQYIAKKHSSIPLMAGNVATYEGAKALFQAGADLVKVGMGPGSICSTRVMSGMGVPQLSALAETVKAARECGGLIIADGGIKTPGDIVKALAAGASSVMLGSLLAGTEESPGELLEVGGRFYKSYRGMGSVKAMTKGSAARYGQKCEDGDAKKLVPEGVEGFVPYKGPLNDHLHQLAGGVRAGMAYLGAGDLVVLQDKARFIRVSQASLIESHPHSILNPL